MFHVGKLYRYFECLYIVNQKLIMLSSADAIRNREKATQLSISICSNIMRIIPCVTDKKTKKIKLDKKSGIIKFKNDIDYLLDSFKKIISKHEKIIISIKAIRNKYEHSIHNLEYDSSYSGSGQYYTITFNTGKNKYEISSKQLINLVKDLNNIFSKIVKTISSLRDNPEANILFSEKLITFDYLEFNKIFESDLLKIIGKFQYDF